MISQKSFHLVAGLSKKAMVLTSGMIIIVAVLSLIGWKTGNLFLTAWIKNCIPMAPSTSVIFFMFGVLFFVTALRPQWKFIRFLMIFASLSTIVYCVYVIFFNESLVRTLHPALLKEGTGYSLINIGKMSPFTAIGFIAAGGVLFLNSVPFNKLFLRIISDTLATLVFLLGNAGVIGYLYGTPLIYGTGVTPVALPTAFLFILLAVTLIMYSGERSSFFYWIFGEGMLYKLVRIFLPLIALFFVIDGWLDLSQPGLSQINPAIYHTIEVIIVLSVITFLFIIIANWTVGNIDAAQKVLRKNEEKFRSLFSNAQVGMFRTRLDGSEFLDLNDKYLSILGRTRQEVMGKSSLIYWADPKEREKIVEILKANGHVDDFECKMLNKSGAVIDCLISVKLDRKMGILEGSIIDITARKKAEEEYKTILQTAMDGFYLVDTEGRIMDVNDAYCSMIGYSREELLKMGIKDVDVMETEEVTRNRIKQIMKIGSARFETKHRHKDGRIIDIEASVHYLKTDKERLFVFMREITDRKRAEASLKLSKESLASAQAIAHIGNWRWDIKEDKVECSDEMCRIYGIEPKDSGFTSKDFIKLTHPDDLPKNIPVDQFLTGRKRLKSFEYRIIRPDGIQRAVRVESSEVEKNPDGTLRSVFGIVQDITDRKLLEGKLVTIARTDELTQLPNRACFMEKVGQELLRAKRTGRQCAILFVDLDNLKSINDTLGHLVGDELIKDSAIKIASCIRETDIMARFGGDEFIVFLNDLDNGEGAQHIAERIREKFNTSRFIMGDEIFITASVGIAIYPQDADLINDLLKYADTAMYAAKESGKNKTFFFNPVMNQNVVIRMQMEKDLRKALDKKEFKLFYQPIIDVAGGKIRGFEALIRWAKTGGGFVYPDDFIPIAEKTGLIIPIGEWVLHEACRFNKQLIDLGYSDLVISVNISVAQMRHGSFLSIVKNALEASGLRPDLLEIEVTESLLIENFNTMIETVEAVRALGIRVALDDFGRGYSSLAYLQKLPIMTLKIDRYFIGEIAKHSDEDAMISTIIDLAHKLELRVVAEGVETKEQLEKLSRDHCDYYQGYFLSEPLAADEVRPFLARVCEETGVKDINGDGIIGSMKNSELLKDDRVKWEIERHRWIESEKNGHDIGFQRASVDWLNRFSDGWIKSHQRKRTAVRRKVKRP